MQEFPKMLYRGRETLTVDDAAAEKAARAARFVDHADNVIEEEAPAPTEDAATIARLELALADKDEELQRANAEIERLKAEIAKVDGDKDGKVGGSKAKAAAQAEA